MLNTVNRKYFASQIFRAINFRVKSFSDKRPRTALSLIMCIIFVRLIFGLAMLSENILTTKFPDLRYVFTLLLRHAYESSEGICPYRVPYVYVIVYTCTLVIKF